MIDGQEAMSKFRHLYERYKNTMYSVAYDISKNVHDAEDIVEISLIKIIKILNTIDSDDIDKPRVRNLVITITKNTAIDYWRKKDNQVITCDQIENIQYDKTAEELYIDMENYREVISCINTLDDKYKEVLRLKVLHDLNSKQIGKLLNITEQNVNVRFMRAKSILLKKLEEHKKNG